MSKRGRPTIGDKAMTPAERKRRERERIRIEVETVHYTCWCIKSCIYLLENSYFDTGLKKKAWVRLGQIEGFLPLDSHADL